MSVVQEILAHHRFGPLVFNSSYTIDQRHGLNRSLKNCPACEEDVNLGNTSFGKLFSRIYSVYEKVEIGSFICTVCVFGLSTHI